jgi:multimeric flavodoxin WrbA
MKITAINGSPRGKGGNTYIMVEEFLAGAREEGAEVEHILLAGKNIHHCIGCFTCWVKTPGVCVFKDDMAAILPKIWSDIFVIATPLYVDNVTGLMKNFLDRCLPSADPHFEPDALGESRHVQREKKTPPKIVIISNCGYPEQTHFEPLKVYFRRVARNMHTEILAEIYRGEGELLKADNLLIKPIQYMYKRLLRKCGREVVKHGRLMADTMAELEKPLISYDSYLKNANEYWDKMLGKLSDAK